MEKKITKKEIVKMLLNQNLETENEEELIELLIDKPIAVDVDKQDKQTEKIGDKIADKLTEFAGSWPFIIGFAIFLLSWIILNIYMFEISGFVWLLGCLTIRTTKIARTIIVIIIQK